MVNEHTPELPRLLTSDEVAGVLRITRRRVAQLAKAGALPAIRIGRRGDYRFRIDDVERLLRGETP